MPVLSSSLGFPRIGAARELKRALEQYWASKISTSELLHVASEIRCRHWTIMRDAGIDHIPAGDFSLYDHMLDMAITVGAIPERYQTISDTLVQYFAMARGIQDRSNNIDVAAMEMTKWFDTNYHYIVPELAPDQQFVLNPNALFDSIKEARKLGIEPRPVIPGPVTFLLLSKSTESDSKGSLLHLLKPMLSVYEELLEMLKKSQIAWVQIDEPCLVLELDEETRNAYQHALLRLSSLKRRPNIVLTTYFGDITENLPLITQSPPEALHLDLVRAPEQFDTVLDTIPDSMTLSLGVIDGRNIWRTNLDAAHAQVYKAVKALGSERVMVGPSCSLMHVPIDLDLESEIDPELKSWLSFATQKLDEIKAISESATMESGQGTLFTVSRDAIATRTSSPRTRNDTVRERIAGIDASMLQRMSVFTERRTQQDRCLGLPVFPTTTIGSFPQTAEVRKKRADWRSGRISETQYDIWMKEETKRCIEKQEALSLDVLVHGEFERNDMVEYFGEMLEGFAFTKFGWVQSYGSRCVKPPILFGDVARQKPMTVGWACYAQSLTKKPVKGMLTGPVTILQWSFVRDDQPRSDTCMQIALALRDEVQDLEESGINIIQVDEPAIREGLPLQKSSWKTYLNWAVKAFRLTTSGVLDSTQIHTHMCYSEFGDILDSIAALDADVLSIETSRSKMELLSDFARFNYPNAIGPGVYDIHSPRVPAAEELVELLERAVEVIPAERVWVNPDCGLKTRGWVEVESALREMVLAATIMRGRYFHDRHTESLSQTTSENLNR